MQGSATLKNAQEKRWPALSLPACTTESQGCLALQFFSTLWQKKPSLLQIPQKKGLLSLTAPGKK